MNLSSWQRANLAAHWDFITWLKRQRLLLSGGCEPANDAEWIELYRRAGP
jgi:hypothetical protein